MGFVINSNFRFMIKSRVKMLKGIFVKCMQCLNEENRNISCTSGGRDDQTATGTKLLDIISSYEF